uniref:BACK domain-containing protein n=1 Tax=Rhabditophanes sp. KR3021 TaxID=114890 RepID=A0AC35U6B1_9BILA
MKRNKSLNYLEDYYSICGNNNTTQIVFKDKTIRFSHDYISPNQIKIFDRLKESAIDGVAYLTDFVFEDFKCFLDLLNQSKNCNIVAIKLNMYLKLFAIIPVDALRKRLISWIKNDATPCNFIIFYEYTQDLHIADFDLAIDSFIKENIDKLIEINAFDALTYQYFDNIFRSMLKQAISPAKIYSIIYRWVEFNYKANKKYWFELAIILKYDEIKTEFLVNEILSNLKLVECPKLYQHVSQELAKRMPCNPNGLDITIPNNIILSGGKTSDGKSVYNYVHRGNKFIRLPNMQHDRLKHSSQKIDNKIFFIGSSKTNVVETYNVHCNVFESCSIETSEHITDFSTSLYNGRIYSIGGWSNEKPMDTVKVLDIQRGTWTYEKPLPYDSIEHDSLVINNAIYVTPVNSTHSSILRFDPRENVWQQLAPNIQSFQSSAVSKINDNIICCGGTPKVGSKCIAQDCCNYYDLVANVWRVVDPLPRIIRNAKACELNDKILLFGGRDEMECSKSIYSFDKISEKWNEEEIELPESNSSFSLIHF